MRHAVRLVPSVLGSFCVGLLLSGCGSRDSKTEPLPDLPLALVGGVAITEADYAFEVERRQQSKRPLSEPRVILNEMIERQAMLQQAEQSAIMQEPEIRRELENRQLGQWLDRSLQVERDNVRVTDADLRAHYETHLDSFKRPAMARMAMLYRKVNQRDPVETTATLRQELEQGRSAFLADPAGATQEGRLPGFGTVAARYSEDTVSRYRGGDLGWLDATGKDGRQPASIIAAGFALATGAVSEVLAAEDGLYVIMKLEQRPESVTSYDEVAPTLRRRIIRLKQEEVERSFKNNLLAKVKVEINQDKAQQLTLPPVTTPEPPSLLPVAGFAPEGK